MKKRCVIPFLLLALCLSLFSAAALAAEEPAGRDKPIEAEKPLEAEKPGEAERPAEAGKPEKPEKPEEPEKPDVTVSETLSPAGGYGSAEELRNAFDAAAAEQGCAVIAVYAVSSPGALPASGIQVVLPYSENSSSDDAYIVLQLMPKGGFAILPTEKTEFGVAVTLTSLMPVALTLRRTADILPGDVDGDGTADDYDAALILRCSVGLIGANDLLMEAADIDGDGTADDYDAALILRYSVGLISSL